MSARSASGILLLVSFSSCSVVLMETNLLPGQDDFQDGHEQKVGQFDTVDNDFAGAVGFAQQGEQLDEKPLGSSGCIRRHRAAWPTGSRRRRRLDDVDKSPTDKCLDTKMIEETR
jgi:hypothetical protein